MGRQGGRVQLEQSDMRLALNASKMAKGGSSHTAMEETQILMKKPRAEVWEDMMRWVLFPRNITVKAAMERHPAMPRENQSDGCLPCQYVTAQNPQTRWRRKGTGAPTPEWLRPPTPEPTPHPFETPQVRPGYNEAAHVSEIEGVPLGYVCIHAPLPSAQCFNLDAYTKDRKRDKDFDPDLLSDAETSTG